MTLLCASHEHSKIVHVVLDRSGLCTLDNLRSRQNRKCCHIGWWPLEGPTWPGSRWPARHKLQVAHHQLPKLDIGRTNFARQQVASQTQVAYYQLPKLDIGRTNLARQQLASQTQVAYHQLPELDDIIWHSTEIPPYHWELCQRFNLRSAAEHRIQRMRTIQV